MFLYPTASASFECENTALDVGFVIPSIENVGSGIDYNAMIESVEKLVIQFNVVPTRYHFALVRYAADAKLIFSLSDVVREKREQLSENLNTTDANLGSDNYIYNALQVACDSIFAMKINRESALDVIILITNKEPSEDDPVTKAYALDSLKVSETHYWTRSRYNLLLLISFLL